MSSSMGPREGLTCDSVSVPGHAVWQQVKHVADLTALGFFFSRKVAFPTFMERTERHSLAAFANTRNLFLR